MFRVLWARSTVLVLLGALFVTGPARQAQSLPFHQSEGLSATISFEKPQSALHFIVPTVLMSGPQSTEGGFIWHYALDPTKVGGFGVNEESESWALLQRPLVLPIEALKAPDQARFSVSEMPIHTMFSQTLLLGKGWKTLPLAPFGSTLYFTRLEHQSHYLKMSLALLNALKAWELPLPVTYPELVVQEHQHLQTVFSGVNHRQELVFLVPEKISPETLYREGAQVMAHELLHLYTGKGQFDTPVELPSKDPILKEGFLTYGGLVLAKEAKLISQEQFLSALSQFQKKAAESTGIPLRPAQPENPLWIRKAYFQGALLAHEIMQNLGTIRFSELFKVLVNHPTVFDVEQLSEIIKAHFYRDLKPLIDQSLENE